MLFNSGMDIFETRRIRLAKIIDDDFAGNQSAFGRHTGYSQSQINKWLSETNVSKRNITNPRRLTRFGGFFVAILETGW